MRCRATRRAWRLHRDERGQAIFLVMLYLMLLAAMVFLVLNSGAKGNKKINMQNTADAVTATGANWYARGLNTISMCNVTQTQLMSVIVLLDTMEEVSPPAQQIIDQLVANLGSTPHGSDVPNNPVLADWLIVQNAQLEQQMMRDMNRLIAAVPMQRYCDYDEGVLWQCCHVLNELAVQMAEIAPEMAQREAMAVGDKNDADVAFVLPFYPKLPIERPDMSGGSFKNFRRPMRDARRVRDRRRRIAGYRHLQCYVSRRHSGTLGPFRYMREPFIEPTPMGLFELSRFSVLFRVVSDKKFDMLFNAPDQEAVLDPEQRIEIYDDLMAFVAANGADAVIHTYWATSSFSSRYEYDTPAFNNNVNLRHLQYPRERLRVFDGLQRAPAGYRRATTMGQGADARHDLWYRSDEHLTPHFPQLGIIAPHPPYHENGTSWPYSDAEKTPYYRNSLWRFLGADVGPSRPLNRRYLPPYGRPPKLAPIILDRTTGWKTAANVRDRFSFVGFAYTEGDSVAAPKWFPNPVPPDNKLICYAQAEVFNASYRGTPRRGDAGWDLFTQNWRSRLVRMDHWDWSRQQIDAGLPDEATFAIENVDRSMVLPVREMLEMYRADVVDLITH